MNSTFSSWKRVLAGMVIGLVAVASRAQTILPSSLPLYFEANHDRSEFLTRGSGYQFLIGSTGVQISLRDSSRTAAANMEFEGANGKAPIQGMEEMPGKVNYLIGSDPSQWQTGLPTFARVQVAEIYPGINLVFHGNQRQLEYDFALAPGANPNAIKIHFNGVDNIYKTSQDDLVIKIGGSEICQPAPVIYQTVGGVRKIVRGGYKILDARTVAFEIADYDHSRLLVIDPVLSYSTFFGGNLGTTGYAIALGTNDCVYMAGQTFSKGFFTTGADQTTNRGGILVGDAFVAKLAGNPATNLIYLTYLGGNEDDVAYGVAVNPAGNAFVAGITDSTNFPVYNALTNHAAISGKPSPLGTYFQDAFVTELNTNGSGLMYSTYLGGESSDGAYGIALDSSDNAYVTGYTFSTNFPVSANALQEYPACSNNMYVNANAFLTVITNGGGPSALVYSTYLGGTNYDIGRAITVDANNNVYVAGYTASYNFPIWNTPTNFLPFLRHLNGATNTSDVNNSFDGFVTKFPPLNGTILPSAQTNDLNGYSAFLGGTNNDMAYGIAVDGTGNAYVTGWTSSTNFPMTNNPVGLFSYLATNGFPNIATNVFLTKISTNGQVLDSTVFGGRFVDIGYGVAVDSAGDAFVTGAETSTNFPTANTSGPLSATNSSTIGANDAFVTAINANWSSVNYSVLIGGNKDTFGYGIALDGSTNVFITGGTDSTNFPTEKATRFWFGDTNFINGTNYINGEQFSGTNDAFLTEIAFGELPVGPVITNPPVSLTNGVGATVSFSVGATGTPPLFYQWYFGRTNLINSSKISGTTSNVLTIANIQATNAGNYKVVVTNNWGSDSTTDSLYVSLAPFIVTPLTNQTVGIGSTVTFAVTANGITPFYYQWLTNDVVLTNGGQFSGAKTNVLILTDAQTNNSGTYTVIVTNNYTITNSLIINNSFIITNNSATNSAMLTVLSAPIMSISLVSNNIANGLNLSAVGGGSGDSVSLWAASNLVTGPIEAPVWTEIASGNFGSQGQLRTILTVSEVPLLTNSPHWFFILEQQ